MSRQLPARPNLEHLKKQAKDLLEHLRRGDPSVQLADAQHALAREYGFASWPRLKAHCELRSDDAARAQSPFTGRWSANLVKSQRHPANQFRRATISFEGAGEDLRITDVVIDAAGREERHVNAIRVDGVEHACNTGDGYSLLARWRDSRTLETVAKKDGQVVALATYRVSADGQLLTIAADRQLIVLDRTVADAAV